MATETAAKASTSSGVEKRGHLHHVLGPAATRIRQVVHAVADALHRAWRGPPLHEVQVRHPQDAAHLTGGAAEEDEVSTASPHVHDPGLVRVQLELQRLELGSRALQRLSCRRLCPTHQDQIVGVPHEHSETTALGLPPAVQGVQVDVARPSITSSPGASASVSAISSPPSPLPPATSGSTSRLADPRCVPRPARPAWAGRCCRRSSDVGVDDKVVATVRRLADRLKRVERLLRPEAVRARLEVRLEDGLDHQLRRHLHHSVPQRRYSPAASACRHSSECTAASPATDGTRLPAARPRGRQAILRLLLRARLRRCSHHRHLTLRGSHGLASTLPPGRHAWRPGRTVRGSAASCSAWHTSTACVAVVALCRWGLWALRPRPRTYLHPQTRSKQGSFPPPHCLRLRRYDDPLGLPLGTTRFRALRLYPSLCPTWAAEEGLSCSARLLRYVPPSLPRGGPARVPERARCLLPSPRHDRLGPPKLLSDDNLTRLARRSLRVAARSSAPSLFHLAFDAPLGTRGSPREPGACCSALRRLPRRDSHPLETRDLRRVPLPRTRPGSPSRQDAPRAAAYAGSLGRMEAMATDASRTSFIVQKRSRRLRPSASSIDMVDSGRWPRARRAGHGILRRSTAVPWPACLRARGRRAPGRRPAFRGGG